MKKWIAALGVWGFSLAFLAGSACAEEEGVPVAVSAGEEALEEGLQPETLFPQVVEINEAGKLTDTYGNMAVSGQICLADGSVKEVIAYQDDTRYFCELGESFFADRDGDAYGYDEAAKMPYHFLFLDDSYGEFAKGETLLNLDLFRLPSFDGAITQNGNAISVDGWADAKESLEPLEECGYERESIDRLYYHYIVDATTKEITETSCVLVKTDQTAWLFKDLTVEFRADKREPDPELRRLIFADEPETVSVSVVSDGQVTDTYTQTVGDGAGISLYFTDAYDPQLYLDAACTRPFLAGKAGEGNLTVYVRKSEPEGAADTQGEDPQDGSGSVSPAKSSLQLVSCPLCESWFAFSNEQEKNGYLAHLLYEEDKEKLPEAFFDLFPALLGEAADLPDAGDEETETEETKEESEEAESETEKPEEETEAQTESPDTSEVLPDEGSGAVTEEQTESFDAFDETELTGETLSEQSQEETEKSPDVLDDPGETESAETNPAQTEPAGEETAAESETDDGIDREDPNGTAACPVCGEVFSTYAGDGLSDYDYHMMLEDEIQKALGN